MTVRSSRIVQVAATLTAVALAAAAAVGLRDGASAATATVDRLSGSTRYDTSAAVSAASFSPGVGVAFVASGVTFPDAMAAAAVAGRDHAPVLLTSATGMSSSVQAELRRLSPAKIVVVGGTSAVPASVQTALAAFTTGAVTRVSGSDRFATAAALSKSSFGAGVANVFVATGRDFPDALSGSAAAGAQGSPVLLVDTNAVPAATTVELQRLQPKAITVLGGTGAVSGAVATALQAIAPVTRIAGTDRYATSAAISKAAFATAARVLLATGSTFADALPAGAVAAGIPGPVLLSASTCLSRVTATELTRLAATRVTLIGGTGALSSTVASLTQCAAAPAPPTVTSAACTTSVWQNLAACGWPGPGNTGYPAGQVFAKTVTGSLVVSTNGAVIDGYRVSGGIQVRAQNVTIRNSWVTMSAGGTSGTGVININPGYSAIIEHNLLDGTNSTHACIWDEGSSMTARYNNCQGTNDGIFSWTTTVGVDGSGDNFTIENNWLHSFTTQAANGHIDGYQTEGAKHGVIRHNTIDVSQDQDSAIAIWNSRKSSDDILVDNNLLAGGGFAVYAEDYSPSETSPAGGYSVTNIRFTNNVFSTVHFGCIGSYGVWFPRGAPTDGWKRSGNTVLETGAKIDTGNPTYKGLACN